MWKRTLPLHPYAGGNYYLGTFLVAHTRKFWRSAQSVRRYNAVHVRLSPEGEVMLEEVIKGDTVREVLD